jgi:hypothetical protein
LATFLGFRKSNGTVSEALLVTSLHERQVIAELIQSLPEASDVAVTEDSECRWDKPLTVTIRDRILRGNELHESLGDGQSYGLSGLSSSHDSVLIFC